ncbi:MAG: nitroreductase family protein [Bacillota bacterium]
METRVSVRTYAENQPETIILNQLEEYTSEMNMGPFGANVRFCILKIDDMDDKEIKRLGTYGVIKGAKYFILGAVEEKPQAMEDLGYTLEKIILKATTLGLGTCWLAGTFRRSAFAEKMGLTDNELLPAIAPIGFAAEKRSTLDKIMRRSAASKKRKPWSELFFKDLNKTPLTEKEAGDFRKVLEAVRIGPSASNRQPWRIIREGEDKYHLYLEENKIYNRMMGKIRIQNIDMGIAMSHFELTARELGLPGSWKVDLEGSFHNDMQYIASWY